MKTLHYTVSDQQITLQIEPKADGFCVLIGDKTFHVDTYQYDEHTISFSVDGVRKQVHHAESTTGHGAHQFSLNGESWTVERVDPRRRRRDAASQHPPGALTASMPGQVREILVSEGTAVSKGDPLLVLEAMKMETKILASTDGVVTALNCVVTDVVERGQILVIISAR